MFKNTHTTLKGAMNLKETEGVVHRRVHREERGGEKDAVIL